MLATRDVVSAELIRVTCANRGLLETEITTNVANNLKEKKLGLFQNEVDYRVLLPDFKPNKNGILEKTKFRLDLAGYTATGFTLCEFKKYDEKKRDKNPWGVLFYFDQDRLKLEHAIFTNKENTTNPLHGKALLVCSVINTDFNANTSQIALMVDQFQKNNPNPPIRKSNYYSILESFEKTSKERNPTWQFEIVKMKKEKVAFLIGSIDLY
jgi:hypothetical protein